MLEVLKITAENVNKIKDVYNDFKSIAKSYYNFETDPLEFEQFKTGIECGVLKGMYAAVDDDPIGFLFYVVEEHRAIELNILHLLEEYREDDIDLDLLEAFVEEAKAIPDWDVISYPMLGGQARFVNKISHVGFKLVGQAIVRFKLTDTLSPQIVVKLELPPMPEGYCIDTWKPEYLDDAAQIIYESFHTAPDAKFDPRFRSVEGCKRVVKMISDSIIGDFLPECTSVLLHDGKPSGICFGNLTTQTIGNVPLIGLMPDEQGHGFSMHLLRNTVKSFIKGVIDATLDCTEINATVETDNFPALKMYRKVGFREDYNYPHAYLENDKK